jgi:hypothetical protein
MVRGQVTEQDMEPLTPVPGVQVSAVYRDDQGNTVVQTTETDNIGRYEGRYAIFLNYEPDSFTQGEATVEVTLTFVKEDYKTAHLSITARYMEDNFHNQQLARQ